MSNALENSIRRAEPVLRQRQVCTYFKIPNDMRLAGDELVFGDTGPCDFMGHDTRGTVLFIEAKMCKKKSLAVPSKSGIRGHQWMALRDCHYAGGHAVIVWQRENEVAVMTWAKANELRGDRRSIPWPSALSKSLEADDPSIVIVTALVDVLELRV